MEIASSLSLPALLNAAGNQRSWYLTGWTKTFNWCKCETWD